MPSYSATDYRHVIENLKKNYLAVFLDRQIQRESKSNRKSTNVTIENILKESK